MLQPQSVIGTHVFRELDGAECAQIFAHDLEQAIINMLATDEFKEKCMEWFTMTGRFGAGACYPVVFMQGKMSVKVYASVESARSKEKMPPPFTLEVPVIQAGETLAEIQHRADCSSPDDCECGARSASELVTEAEVTISRAVGLSTENAVDKARLEVGIVPLVPTRHESGAIINAPGKHLQRQDDYDARKEKRRITLMNAKAVILARRAQREAEAAGTAERERIDREAEARSQE